MADKPIQGGLTEEELNATNPNLIPRDTQGMALWARRQELLNQARNAASPEPPMNPRDQVNLVPMGGYTQPLTSALLPEQGRIYNEQTSGYDRFAPEQLNALVSQYFANKPKEEFAAGILRHPIINSAIYGPGILPYATKNFNINDQLIAANDQENLARMRAGVIQSGATLGNIANLENQAENNYRGREELGMAREESATRIKVALQGIDESNAHIRQLDAATEKIAHPPKGYDPDKLKLEQDQLALERTKLNATLADHYASFFQGDPNAMFNGKIMADYMTSPTRDPQIANDLNDLFRMAGEFQANLGKTPKLDFDKISEFYAKQAASLKSIDGLEDEQLKGSLTSGVMKLTGVMNDHVRSTVDQQIQSQGPYQPPQASPSQGLGPGPSIAPTPPVPIPMAGAQARAQGQPPTTAPSTAAPPTLNAPPGFETRPIINQGISAIKNTRDWLASMGENAFNQGDPNSAILPDLFRFANWLLYQKQTPPEVVQSTDVSQDANIQAQQNLAKAKYDADMARVHANYLKSQNKPQE